MRLFRPPHRQTLAFSTSRLSAQADVTGRGSASAKRQAGVDTSPPSGMNPQMDAVDSLGMQPRTIVQAEACSWLGENPSRPGDAVITSLPDVSETSGLPFGAWRQWFIDTARQIIRWLPAESPAIFFQSDIRRGAQWVDKSYLVMRAADLEEAPLVWHKIACRRPPGTIAIGRPSYSHMLCVVRQPGTLPLRPGPDVLPDVGHMSWSRAMGVEACKVACQYLVDETLTRRVVDPFCGHGTVLAVANAMGLAGLGIELGGKRCRIARNLAIGI